MFCVTLNPKVKGQIKHFSYLCFSWLEKNVGICNGKPSTEVSVNKFNVTVNLLESTLYGYKKKPDMIQ